MNEDQEDHMEAPDIIHYFVDEAGDPVLFDGKGRVLVGNDGCSKYFIVGKLDVEDPDDLNAKLESLRAELLTDPYLKRVPSMQPERGKTCAMFHAKDDVPEVRQAVFKLLRSLDLRFYAVVRDKEALVRAVRVRNVQEPHYRYRPDEQYDGLISDLFRHFHGTADITHVCFARRSKRNRTAALYTALEQAKEEFKRSFSFAMPGRFEIECGTPRERAGLQAVDYYLWALQRHYEREESRYLEYIWPQVGEIHALDEIAEGRVGVLYSQRRPLAPETDGQT